MKIISICKLSQSFSSPATDPRNRLILGGLRAEDRLRDNIADLVKVEWSTDIERITPDLSFMATKKNLSGH